MKGYFFDLSEGEPVEIFDEYEDLHGTQSREYEVETLPKWKSGRVPMSGRVATRLFQLLPPHMPVSEKYTLTENLWKHVGPSSQKLLRVGVDAAVTEVMDLVRDHISKVVTHYTIPDSLDRRFTWLTAGDVQVKQEILNQLRDSEIQLVTEGVRSQFPVLQQ